MYYFIPPPGPPAPGRRETVDTSLGR